MNGCIDRIKCDDTLKASAHALLHAKPDNGNQVKIFDHVTKLKHITQSAVCDGLPIFIHLELVMSATYTFKFVYS